MGARGEQWPWRKWSFPRRPGFPRGRGLVLAAHDPVVHSAASLLALPRVSSAAALIVFREASCWGAGLPLYTPKARQDRGVLSSQPRQQWQQHHSVVVLQWPR